MENLQEKTQYRSISNGYHDYLQYKTIVIITKFFSCKKEKRELWRYVPQPYYDSIYGRGFGCEFEIRVCTSNTNLEEFTKKWPHIEEYLEYYRKKQDELVQAVREKERATEKKKGVIKYF